MRSSSTLPVAIAAIAASAAVLSAPIAAQGSGGFRSGDLYLLTPSYTGSSSSDGAILHVGPVTGVVTQIVDLQGVASSPGMMTYDPWRDRLLFAATPVGLPADLYELDASGALVGLGYTSGVQLNCLTPRGDGIVYLIDRQSGTFSYLDQADQLGVLTGPGGAPYSLAVSPANVEAMVFDAPTNSLVLATTSNIGACPGGSSEALNLRRLDLASDGKSVVAETCFQYDVKPGASGEVPEGLSRGPNGDLMLAASMNGWPKVDLIARIDVAGASATAFATPDYAASWVVSAGAYSQTLDRAIVTDVFGDSLRAFPEGGVGAGVTIASGIGLGGAATTLVEIAPVQPLFGLTTTSDSLSLSSGGTQAWSLDLGPGDAGAIYLVLGSVTGFNPGVPAGASLLPLNQDAWFVYTLGHPGSALLPGSVGVLDGLGKASAALALPPGLDPSFAGVTAHHAAVVLSPSLTPERTTNAVALTLLP